MMKLDKQYNYEVLWNFDKNWIRSSKQGSNDGPVSLHWLIGKFPSYQTLTLRFKKIGLKHETPTTGLKLVAHFQCLVTRIFLYISLNKPT